MNPFYATARITQWMVTGCSSFYAALSVILLLWPVDDALVTIFYKPLEHKSLAKSGMTEDSGCVYDLWGMLGRLFHTEG